MVGRHSQAALDRFAALVSRHEAGERFDFAQELSTPAELAAELRQLHAGWSRMRDALGIVRADREERRAVAKEPGLLQLDSRTQVLLDLLARLRGSEGRYVILDEIARGGMGVVLRAREQGLERELALKRMPNPEEMPPELRRLRPQLLRRFLDEAWILARLDHPGIVPLHELGVDAEGRAYFTMPLVRGRTLGEVFRLARGGREGWNLASALDLLLRVCDTLAFAHSVGIVHRDLKPSNVMVGRFGEVHVMDWGLARVLDRPVAAPAALTPEEDAGDGSASLTLAGDVLGTPAYMAPEQAQGHSSRATPRADVYACGAMLYELLAGERPYLSGRASCLARELVERVKAGPPRPIEELAPRAPPELQAVCRKAMQRDPARRYSGMEELAADLRAFRDGRVVRALESGAWAEMRKWVRRNRRVAAALALALSSLLSAGAATLWIQARAQRRLAFEADKSLPAALRARARALWPAREERIGEYESWLAEARALQRRWELEYAPEQARLRALGVPLPADHPRARHARHEHQRLLDEARRDREGVDDELHQLDARAEETGARQAREMRLAQRAALDARIERLLEGPADAPRAFSDPGDEQLSRELDDLERGLERLTGDDPQGNTLREVTLRLERARSLRALSLSEPGAAWSAACAAIGDRARNPVYGGLVLRPQFGLVPLGPDPASGLWEFAHLESGAPAERRADGTLALGPETGIVLVLLPAGRFWMGALRPGESNPGALVPDPGAQVQEGPVHEIGLDAFFLSKYELTQAQWRRLAGTDPSYSAAGTRFGGTTADLLFPVERMTWIQATEVLARVSLGLPSEAQWEYAARAGTHTPWWWGETPADACGRVNARGREGSCPPDPYENTARVDSFGPNPWGFFCIAGNVGEWTADNYWTSYRWPHAPGTGLQLSPDSGLRAIRGGHYGSELVELRATFRTDCHPEQPVSAYGLRPARAIDP